MTAAELQNLRVCLLQQLRAIGDFALPADALTRGARLVGFPAVDEQAIRTELAYLADKGLVTHDLKKISPELRRWRLTAAGRDFLAEEGL